MRVLLLCPKPPVPATDGGAFAQREIAIALAEAGCRVTVLSLTTAKHPMAARFDAAIAGPEPRLMSVALRAPERALRAGAAWLTGGSAIASRFRSAAAVAALARLLAAERFDVVQLEGLGSLAYLADARRDPVARLVYRAHNVEREVLDERAATARSPLARALFAREAAAVGRLECAAWREVDAIAAISDEVATACSAHARCPVRHVPVSAELTAPAASTAGSDVFHLGALDWHFNREGALWLLREVWPLVRAQRPGATLRLAGRGSSELLRAHPTAGAVADGVVADAAACLRAHGVMVVPVLRGSGVRVKLVEALAAGCAIVSTAAGARGTTALAGRDLLVADSAAGFAAAVVQLLAEPGRRSQLGRSARAHAVREHSREVASRSLLALYEAAGARRS